MDLGIILAIIGSAIAMIGVMIALFLWNRSEANSDRRELANAMLSFKDTVLNETKDFHARLCAIEERTKKL